MKNMIINFILVIGLVTTVFSTENRISILITLVSCVLALISLHPYTSASVFGTYLGFLVECNVDYERFNIIFNDILQFISNEFLLFSLFSVQFNNNNSNDDTDIFSKLIQGLKDQLKNTKSKSKIRTSRTRPSPYHDLNHCY